MQAPIWGEIAVWTGILFCITQSAMFSGLNIAFFSNSRLRLELEASKGNKNAQKVLALKKDSNFVLTTILWGNVGINVLLTLLSNSVMAGVFAFLFSTFVITFLGEIIPQAYFSRHALKMAGILSPVFKVYQILLFPIAKPVAKALDFWLGEEGIKLFEEADIRRLLKMHIHSDEADVDHVEGTGALNFLDFDDLKIHQEGRPIDPESIISLPFKNGKIQFPVLKHTWKDPFLKRLEISGKKWVVITDTVFNEPQLLLDADGFVRSAIFREHSFVPEAFCHRPIVVKDKNQLLGEIIVKMKMSPQKPNDDVIDKDTILLWADEKRIITGADILGRLLRGIILHRKV